MFTRWFAATMIALTVLPCARADDAAKKSPDASPSLEFTLEIDGKSVDIAAGEKTTVNVGGKDVAVKLVPKPDRLFKTDGISFRFPREFNYAVDRETPEVAIHTFTGDDTTLMVQRMNQVMDVKAFQKLLIDGLVQQFGEKTRVEPIKITLGGKEYSGTRLLVVAAGQSIRQDVYTFTTGGKPCALFIQVSGDKGDQGAETKATVQLLDKTLKVTP